MNTYVRMCACAQADVVCNAVFLLSRYTILIDMKSWVFDF
jgi:hypothetical protein